MVIKAIKNLIYKLAKKIVDEHELANRVLTPSFWFMSDGHGFGRPRGNNIDEIKSDFLLIAKDNPHGMVCSVTILEEGKPERHVGENCHVDKDGNVNLDKWYEDVIKEDCVRNYKK